MTTLQPGWHFSAWFAPVAAATRALAGCLPLRATALAVLAASAVLFGAPDAAAQATPMYACVMDGNGAQGRNLRLVGATQACRPRETKISWNQLGPAGPVGPEGPAGPKGDAGTPGEAGAAGPAGPVGPAGPAGTNGLDGAIGPAGPDGATGPIGPEGPVGPVGPAGANGVDGAQGPAGPVGPAGPSGEIGPQGPKGDTGATGAAGANGADGADGATGEVGPAGPVGPTGSAGTNGLDGAIGPAGPDGAIGPIGPEGPVGPVGPVGPAGANGVDGPQGPKGDTGATGAAGANGADGADGATGEVGPTGSQGPTGPAGAVGPAGPQGPTGDQGPAGPAGANGANGADGAQGPAGEQGPKGDQGEKGDTGEMGPPGPAGGGVVDPNAMTMTTNVRVNLGGGTKPFFATQISRVGFTVPIMEAALGEGEYTQYTPAGTLSFDAVRVALPTQPEANGGRNLALVAMDDWWATMEAGQVQRRSVSVEVLNSNGTAGTHLTLLNAFPSSYDPLLAIVTLQVGGIGLTTLNFSGAGPLLPGRSYSADIGPADYEAAGPNGGATEFIVGVGGVGSDQFSEPRVLGRRITPFNVRLQASAKPALGEWINEALINVGPRDLSLSSATQPPDPIYGFADVFVTRVIFIGPTLAAGLGDQMPVAVDITVQPNGKYY